jgi:hypothetical protein
LLTFIVSELEADLIAAAPKRRAELLRRADQYEQDKLPSLERAGEVASRMKLVSMERPRVLPGVRGLSIFPGWRNSDVQHLGFERAGLPGWQRY